MIIKYTCICFSLLPIKDLKKEVIRLKKPIVSFKHQLDLIDMITEIKRLLHEFNHSLFQANMKDHMVQLLGTIWLKLHRYRDREEVKLLEPNLVMKAVDASAAMSTKLRKSLLEADTIRKEEIEVEYMKLRQYIARLEKDIARQFHLANTGIVSEKVLTIEQAAKRSGKSNITIRRHLKNETISAYKLIKLWWIPIEELPKLSRGKKR